MACAEAYAGEFEPVRTSSFLELMRRRLRAIRLRRLSPRTARLQHMRQHNVEYRASQSEEDRAARLQHMRQHNVEYRASQSEEDRAARLQHMRQHNVEYRASQSEEDRAARLQHMRQRDAERRASQSEADRVVRLLQMRQRNAESRKLSRASITGFTKSINTFCDKICEVCTKRCYQVARHNEKVLQSFESKGTAIYTIKAQDQLIYATRNLGNKDLDSVIPNDINKTGGLPSVLKIFVGAKVMLRSNIDVSKGLVNGNMGFITEIIRLAIVCCWTSLCST
ncbi:hypothetical protein J6590_000143 [Homalodisca vitripennis]|nr:hypothetical protein J6590_000143 [Homalodisca vitripennis]